MTNDTRAMKPISQSPGPNGNNDAKHVTTADETATIPAESSKGEPTKSSTRGRKGMKCKNLSNQQRTDLLQFLMKHKHNKSSLAKSARKRKLKEGNDSSSSGNDATAATIPDAAKSSAVATDGTTDPNSKSWKDHKLRKGALLEASRKFEVSTKTCKRIWERFWETALDAEGAGGDVSHRKHQSGRPKKISASELSRKIRACPVSQHKNSIRGLARALGMPHTTIHRRIQSGEIPWVPTPTTQTEEESKENDDENENGDFRTAPNGSGDGAGGGIFRPAPDNDVETSH